MMRKSFLTLSIILLGLFVGANTASAINVSGMTPEQAETLGFWARLTAKPATTTTGSGKVYVVWEEDYSGAPADGDYLAQMSDDGWSDIFLMSSLVDSDVSFRVWAKSNDGSYFKGWSFTDGYTDLGTGANITTKVTPSSTKSHAEVREHFIYAAFEKVSLVSYEMVSGSQEVADDGAGNWKCIQTIKFRAETPGFWALSSTDDVRHFKAPVIAKKAGTTGAWSVDISEWTSSNATMYGDYAELNVPVTFTAPNSDVAEYAATLTLETEAGVKMIAYLYARKTAAGAQAIRYNKSKVQQEAGNLTDLLSNAAADDIIKLNGNYSDAVEINKNITFDLNGYTLSNTLTVSGGNVMLAYSPYGGTISNNVSVTAGKLTLVGGTITGNINVSAGATLEQNGAAITGTVTNAGTMTTTDGSITGQLASSGTLTLNGGTFTNTSGVAVSITGGTADIKRGIITGSTYGVQTTGGSATIGKLAAVSGTTKALYGNGGTLTVNNGKFTDPANLIAGTVTFNAGYFQTNNAGGSIVLGKQVWRNTAGVEYREGYAFFVGDQNVAQASNVSVCRIGHTSYASLEDALAYVNNTGKEVYIIMENDYVLPAGYYTLPANATLVVPMSNDQETDNPVIPRSTSGTPVPVSFRKLTLAKGVNFEVAGTIEMTCTQHGSGETMGIPGGNYGHLILKSGSHMTINNGGELRAWGFVTGDGTTDAEGNYLSGEIDVRRGGIVREMFQMGDWKGGDISLTMVIPEDPYLQYQHKTHLFPIYTYFIQNIESPVKYHPGSSLVCATSVNVSNDINAYANDIKVVGKEGEPAMFLMDEMADAENTWVRKWYDAKKDQQVYEVNSGAKLGSVVIDLGEIPGAMFGKSGSYHIQLDSRKFILPLTNNFKIHLLSGHMEFTQSTSCLPGMEVEVNKESEVAIVKNEDASVVSGALYFYDADQWSYNGTKGYVGNSGKFGAIVKYSPTWDLGTNGATKSPNVRNINSLSAIGDAILNVHGTFRMSENCAVYTTWKKDNTLVALDESGSATGGASIISTNEDAGTFIFDADAPAFSGVVLDESGNFVSVGQNCLVNYDRNDYAQDNYPVRQTTIMGGTPHMYSWELCTSAKLKNGDGTFAITEGTEAGKSYCYMNNRWTYVEVDSDNECFMVDNYGVFYAKPAEYVAVVATKDGDGNITGNDDHTYSDLAGAGRLFILMDDCQWWEVEKKDNFYHCIHPNNDTYYYWKEAEVVCDPLDPENCWTVPAHWEEKKFTITWLNWDGSEIKSYIYDAVTGDPEEVEYSVTYGTMAEFLGSNPTRPENIDYTYDFTGWNPELGPVKSDVTYTATYVEQPRKYTIIFTEEGGAEIERQFLTHNEVPVCENTPTRTGFTLQWEPAIAAVTGDATYRATWLEEPPTEYAITFFDYDGTTKLKPLGETPYMVAVGEMPVAPTAPNGKPATSEFTYVFDHWSPALSKVTQAMSYTAVYREEARTYTISYYKEDGSTLLSTEELPYGATPTPPAVSKENPETGHTYTLVWKNLAETGTIQTVMGDVSYKPTYIDEVNMYTVTVKSNPSEACVIYGNGMYEYSEDDDAIEIAVIPNEDYTFIGWSDGAEIGEPDEEDGAYVRLMSITSDINLVANFSYSGPATTYTIQWKNENGSDITSVTQVEGTATTYTGATPTKDATAQYTYKFDGWTTEANGAGTYYKNGLTPVASADVTYYAHFSSTVNTYKVTLTSNPAGACTFTGAGTYKYGDAISIDIVSYNTTNYEFTGWSAAVPTTVTGEINLTANFSARTYTVTWKSEDGSATLETDASQIYGTATAFDAAAPTKAGYTFAGWTTQANGNGSFYTDGATPAVTGDATYYAYFTALPQVTLTAGIGETVAAEAKAYTTITITSNGVSSGEITNADLITSCDNAYFDLAINAAANTWYAIAVPWQVEVSTGITVGGVRQVANSDYYMAYYNGDVRAANGKINECWSYMGGGDIMQPGVLYMLYMTHSAATIRFQKKASAPIQTTKVSVYAHPQSTGSETDAGWNGIANPALFHAFINANAETYGGVNFGQRYNPSAGNYDAIDLTQSENQLIVGGPVFVQVAADKTNFDVYDTWANAALHAPVRRSIVKDSYYEVHIAAGEAFTDRVYLMTREDKEDTYVIGLDLAKAGVSTQVAQMWVDRYNAQLCVNTTAPVGSSATYPLGIFAPQDGDYQIYSATDMQAGQELYVTRNGRTIWNLAYGPYTATLNAGTNNEYGLKLIQAPAVTTGVDPVTNDQLPMTNKVVIDDHVYIIRDGAVYTVTGQKVQ